MASGVHVSSIKSQFVVFGILMVFTVMTVLAAYQDFGVINTPLALLIAAIKATVVVLYFMHLRWSTKLMALAAASSVLFLFILVGLVVGDYVAQLPVRGW